MWDEILHKLRFLQHFVDIVLVVEDRGEGAALDLDNGKAEEAKLVLVLFTIFITASKQRHVKTSSALSILIGHSSVRAVGL